MSPYGALLPTSRAEKKMRLVRAGCGGSERVLLRPGRGHLRRWKNWMRSLLLEYFASVSVLPPYCRL